MLQFPFLSYFSSVHCTHEKGTQIEPANYNNIFPPGYKYFVNADRNVDSTLVNEFGWGFF